MLLLFKTMQAHDNTKYMTGEAKPIMADLQCKIHNGLVHLIMAWLNLGMRSI